MSEININGASFVMLVKDLEQLKPISSKYEEQYFDVFCYTNAVDLLFQEFTEKDVTIVRGPNYSVPWNEFTIRDINGYQIAIGGDITNKDLIYKFMLSFQFVKLPRYASSILVNHNMIKPSQF